MPNCIWHSTLVRTTAAGPREAQVTMASSIQLEWLEEFFPAAVSRQRLTRYDESRNGSSRRISSGTTTFCSARIRCRRSTGARPDSCWPRPSGRAASLVRAHDRAAHRLARLDFVREALPELGWTDFDDETLAEVLAAVCQGKTSLDEVEQADFVPFLQSRLEPGLLRELDESARETIKIPSGRQVRLTYEIGRPPILAARLQELFGWTETPRLARGRVPVLLHLLGPNNRPVQITNDLRSFWTTTYHQVRKDLRRRYPEASLA